MVTTVTVQIEPSQLFNSLENCRTQRFREPFCPLGGEATLGQAWRAHTRFKIEAGGLQPGTVKKGLDRMQAACARDPTGSNPRVHQQRHWRRTRTRRAGHGSPQMRAKTPSTRRAHP